MYERYIKHIVENAFRMRRAARTVREAWGIDGGRVGTDGGRSQDGGW